MLKKNWLLYMIALGLITAVACGTNTGASGQSGSGNGPSAATQAPGTESSGSAASDPTATPGSQETDVASSSPTPQPDYLQELRRAGISTGVWKTDFSKRSVPYSEILSGGVPRDGIPPIDNPSFVATESADQWLKPLEPVIAFEQEGEAKAYPLQILIWHEIVNDEVGGVPVAVTFCPLCNSAIVFDRRLEGTTYDFGVSGNLRNSDLIMWDRQTQSWWQQLTGEAIVGELTGKKLTFLPAPIISWEDFKASHPDGQVLSRDTGYQRPYGENPYVGYDRADQSPFLFRGELDDRLQPMERVAAFSVGDVDVAFPFTVLDSERVVNYAVGGEDVVVFFKPGTRSALDGVLIGDSKEVGATGVFEPMVNGQKLTFRAEGDNFVDDQTGSTWNILGEAVSGEMAGENLTPVIHANHFWFSWGAFKPDTLIYKGQA